MIRPSSLQGLLQNLALTGGINLNAPSCGYSPTQFEGGFNWLLHFNSSTRTVTTGGALPVQDPYRSGYAFLRGTYNDGGTLVAPACLDAGVAEKASGEISFSTETGPGVLNIPIFTSLTMPGEPIVLPIRGAQFSEVTISTDHDCIGDINQAWYASGQCLDDALNACPKWYTAGAFAGYIKLEEADKIVLRVGQGQSLCIALVQDVNSLRCTTEDLKKGDYCSTTRQAGGCGDSVWLAATFAANAVKIDLGDAGLPGCK